MKKLSKLCGGQSLSCFIKSESFLFGLFTILIAFIGLLNTNLLSEFFSIEEFGRYQLLLTFVGIFSAASLTGYDNFFKRSMIAGDERQFYYYYSRILPIALGFILVCAGTIFFLDLEHGRLLLLATTIVAFLLFDKLSSVLSAKLLFKKLRCIDLVSRLLFLSLTLVMIWLNTDFETYILFLLALHICNHLCRTGLLFFWIQMRQPPLNDKEKSEFNRGALKNSAVVLYATIGAWIERAILGWLNPADLAIFSIGYLIPKLVKDNMKSFLTPVFYTWSKEGFDYQYKKINEKRLHLLALGAAVFLAVAVGSYLIITLFFVKYEAAITVALILAISLIPLFLIYGYAHATLMSQHVSVNNRVEFIASSVKIILAVSIVPTYCIWGAVSCLMLSETLRFSLYYWHFNRIVATIK